MTTMRGYYGTPEKSCARAGVNHGALTGTPRACGRNPSARGQEDAPSGWRLCTFGPRGWTAEDGYLHLVMSLEDGYCWRIWPAWGWTISWLILLASQLPPKALTR